MTLTGSHRLRHHARTVATGVVSTRPAPSSHRVALRAGSTMLVALTVLATSGHVAWALYACFGAFTAIYAGASPYRGRWRTQVTMGAVLAVATTCGALIGTTDARAWLGVIVTAACAGALTKVSDRFSLVPPGPLFGVFAVSACASVPGTATQVWAALGVSTATVALAVLLGLADEFHARRAGAHPGRPPRRERRPGRERAHALWCAAAVLLAGLVATTLAQFGVIGHPYWAMVSAVVPFTVPRWRDQVIRSVQRGVGTALGITVAYLILLLAPPVAVVVALAAVLQGLAEMTVPRNYAAALLFITPLALVLGQLAHPVAPGALVADRLLETLIGLAVGLLLAGLSRERQRSSDGGRSGGRGL